MEKELALVGVVPRKELWDVIQKERWYHIPVSANSAPKSPELIRYIAFYFPGIFGEELGYKIIWYAKVLSFEIKKRIFLFPDEPNDKNAGKDYFQFYLGELQKLPKAIVSRQKRKDFAHIPTNTEKLFNAEEINDLWWDESPLEDIMHAEFKKRKIEAERQWLVKPKGHNYFLDFALFAGDKKIDIECDGNQHRSTQEAIEDDKIRDGLLKSDGWEVARFTWDEIHKNLEGCFKIIESIINSKKY